MIEIFEKLANTSSSNAKKAILSQYKDDELFKRILYLALDPHVRFYVKKIPPYTTSGENKDIKWAFASLTMLSERKVTGHAAIDLLQQALASVSKDDARIIEKIIAKDLRCGVSSGLVNKVFPKLISEFDVPLCAVYDEKAQKKYTPKRFTTEPKYDGMRVVTFVEQGDVSFWSRAGKPIETLDHIVDEILALVGTTESVVFDSEAVSGTFQNTMSAVKRLGKNKTEQAKLILFDVVDFDDFDRSKCDVIQEERTERLFNYFNNASTEIKYLDITKPDMYDPESDETPVEFIYRMYEEYRKQGYEGLIIKDLDGKNEFKRSRAWMKVKPCETIDVEITGFIEGSGKNKGKLGAFTYNYEGKPCRVGGGFSDKQREEFWERRFEMVGTMIEIEIMEATETGSTRHSVFIRERDFKGEKS